MLFPAFSPFPIMFSKVENMVGKGENAGFQHFLLSPLCFQKASFLGVIKSRDCVETVHGQERERSESCCSACHQSLGKKLAEPGIELVIPGCSQVLGR